MMKDRLLPPLVVILMSLTALGQAHADDDEIVEPSEAQYQLYQEGAEAFKGEDYNKAIDLFKASLHLGELNITYLNMGRAHYKLGQCQEALEAYIAAERSPKLANPTPAQVQAKLDEYKADLYETCPAQLVVECISNKMEVYVGNEGPFECTEPVTMERPAGEVTLRAELGNRVYEEVVVLQAMRKVTITMGQGTPAKVSQGGKPRRSLGVGRNGRGGRPKNALLTVGARMATVIAAGADVSATVTAEGDTDSIDQTITEETGLAINGYGLIGVGDYIGVGGSVWFFPSVNLGSTGSNVGLQGDFSELDLNGMLALTLPLAKLDTAVFVEGGVSVLTPPNSDPVGDPYTGFNFGAGVGSAYNFGALRLLLGVRMQFYDVSRQSEFEGAEIDLSLSGQRITFELGLSYALF